MANMKPDGCVLSIPYPEPAAERRNIRYARLLSQDYAGMASELTAVNQYFYQHLLLNENYPDIAETLDCISITEMRHMEMLGKTITLLGGDPQIGGVERGTFVYWNGKYPDYTKNPRQMLRNNIKAEQRAIAAYTMRIRQIDDGNIRKMLERIILDEEHHIEIFKELLDSL